MMPESRKVAVTGANGFVGKNLVLHLREEGHEVWPITRETDRSLAEDRLAAADAIFHLAGANRPSDDCDFLRSNRDYTEWLARAVRAGANSPLIVYSSSVQAASEGDYGRSKRAGEQVLLELGDAGAATVSIWRLPNLFGKWSRPNYNSVIATFCHNAARGLPLRIDDPSTPLSLLYIDDLAEQWVRLLDDPPSISGFADPQYVQKATVGQVAELIQAFAEGRAIGEVRNVSSGLERALYASFISALPVTDASYPLAAQSDQRGRFVELLKTDASGQFSYFTAHPGVTRGGHYHHSKVEKFLVTHGTARFRFRHVHSGEAFEVIGSAAEPQMIESIPGWAHDVTNIGEQELVVLTWANERFDPNRPDTHPMPL